MKRKFYITTPIYYVNDRPHIGHAYTTLAADILARYHRLNKERVFFLTGTDEHGGKIEKRAKYLKKNPKELCDENSSVFKKSWKELNLSFDNFIRTTDSNHIKAVQKTLDILYKKKFIKKGVYRGLYCSGCEQYKLRSDLVNGKCPEHKTKPQLIKEESYLFRLSFFKKELEKRIKNDDLKIRPKDKVNEVLEFLKHGLNDISISRQRVKWGIPLPFDKRFTLYVWIDAFLNYLTGLGWQGDPKKIPDFWPPDIQLMSKDILRVHATIWPALLLALDIPLPRQLSIHGYFTVDNQKMSKSLDNIIFPKDMINRFGVDATRYLIISATPFGRDGDVSWKKFEEKYSSDLAKGLGNLFARVVTLADKFRIKRINPKTGDLKVKKEVQKAREAYKMSLDNIRFGMALNQIWNLISFCDKYIEKERPWENQKSKRNKFLAGERKNQSVISDLLFILKNIAKMLQPFIPETSEKILKFKKIKPLFPKLKPS